MTLCYNDDMVLLEDSRMKLNAFTRVHEFTSHDLEHVNMKNTSFIKLINM